jgi:hypothetical protein
MEINQGHRASAAANCTLKHFLTQRRGVYVTMRAVDRKDMHLIVLKIAALCHVLAEINA